MIVKSLDGIDVDITHCDAGHPPNSPKGSLNLNTGAVWCKPAGKEWIRSGHRSAMVTARIVKFTNAKDLAVALVSKEIVDDGPKSSGGEEGPAAPAKLQSLQGHSAHNAYKASIRVPKI